jgi:hypothetical protein
MHKVRLIVDRVAAHCCAVVKKVAKERKITVDCIPCRLTAFKQPLDGFALGAECRAIYRDEMSQRVDKRD